jgi:catechol 2,3-dioxygenase-like lactoylglutathione lyase family enzyme
VYVNQRQEIKAMTLRSSYPVLMVDDPKVAADFYVRFFGFEETFSTDWYVSLRHGARPESELAFVRAGHESIPAGYRTSTRGLLINLEVDDAAGEYDRLVERDGLEALLPLRDEAFGHGNEYRGDDESDDVESAGNREPDDGPSSCGSRAPVTQSTAHATPTATTRPSASLSASESDPVASDNIATAITATRHVNGWVQRNSRGRVAPPLACPSRSTAATPGRRAARPTRLQPGLNRRPPRQRRPAS